MKPIAIAFMVFILAVVWGGFAVLLRSALRKETKAAADDRTKE